MRPWNIRRAVDEPPDEIQYAVNKKRHPCS